MKGHIILYCTLYTVYLIGKSGNHRGERKDTLKVLVSVAAQVYCLLKVYKCTVYCPCTSVLSLPS